MTQNLSAYYLIANLKIPFLIITIVALIMIVVAVILNYFGKRKFKKMKGGKQNV